MSVNDTSSNDGNATYFELDPAVFGVLGVKGEELPH